jgi:hypothetical protein
MMNPQKQITTNAPSIRYEGDLRAEQAGIMQKHAQAMQQMQQQAMMQQQQQGMMQPQMQPQMGQPQMPQGRMPAAYGGIMGVDGRKQYGIGSWFQEKIMDPIKNNPITSTVIGGALLNQFGIPGTGTAGDRMGQNWFGDIFKRDAVWGPGGEGTGVNDDGSGANKSLLSDIMQSSSKDGPKTPFGLSPGMLSTIGGGVAGLFSDKLNPPDAEGNIDYGAGIGIKNIAQAANILDPKQGMAAGLRFLPELSTRKYSPAEMLLEYGSANEPIESSKENQPALEKENINYRVMDGIKKPAGQGTIGLGIPDSSKSFSGRLLAEGGISQLGIPDYGQQMMDPNMMEQIKMMVESMQAQGMGKEEMEQAVKMQVPNMSADMSMGFAEGGSSGEMGTVMEEGEEMLDMNGMEKDYREDGGFVPIGEYEKKDDVPARLSVNEFVFTADAVRGAGDGDVDKGAERLQGIMKQLEQQGRPEGMGMLDVSERLSEVV